MNSRIAFPAIAVAPGDSFRVISGLDELSRCNFLAVRNGYFKQLFLFDSHGLVWPVAHAELDRPPSLWDRLLNRRFGVTLQFAEPRENGLEYAKSALCELIDNDPDDLYDQFVPHDELKTLVRAAEDAAALIDTAETLGAAE